MLSGCRKPMTLPQIDNQFLDNPITMNLQGQGGQQIQLAYEDGEWIMTSLESSKEIRRLQRENDRLGAENIDLQRQLKKALRLASTLQLDLQKLTEQSSSVIAFSSEQKRKQFLETDPAQIIQSKLQYK